MPKVSVIVPNYNHAKYLRQRIDSILHQTFQDFELILLDDCSTDNSVEILNSYANHPKVKHLVLNEANSGSTFKQWNKGLNLAQGEFIWIAESDDTCSESFLEIMVNKLCDENADFVFCDSHKIDEDSVIIGDYLSYYDFCLNTLEIKGFDPRVSLVANGNGFVGNVLTKANIIINASGTLFKKDNSIFSILSKVQKYKHTGDWVFYSNYLIGKKMCFLNLKLNSFRQHSSTTRNNLTVKKRIRNYVEFYMAISESNKLVGKKMPLYYFKKHESYLIDSLRLRHFPEIFKLAIKFRNINLILDVIKLRFIIR